MTAMKFVVKYFAEIVIKRSPVQRRFVAQLRSNLLDVLRLAIADMDLKVYAP